MPKLHMRFWGEAVLTGYAVHRGSCYIGLAAVADTHADGVYKILARRRALRALLLAFLSRALRALNFLLFNGITLKITKIK